MEAGVSGAREIAKAIAAHDDFLAGFLDRPPQTNELGRSSVILGGALIAAAATGLPLETFEIGPSAGLNLHFDRYAHELGVGSFGSLSATLRLSCDWRGARARRRVADRLPRRLRRRSAPMAAIAGAGAAATREAPLARLQMEADGDTRSAALTLTLWPETFALGRADFHGR